MKVPILVLAIVYTDSTLLLLDLAIPLSVAIYAKGILGQVSKDISVRPHTYMRTDVLKMMPMYTDMKWYTYF